MNSSTNLLLVVTLGGLAYAAARVTSGPWATRRKGVEVLPEWPGVLRPRRTPTRVNLLTYPELITYFVSHRPAEPRVRRGAILRQRSRRGYVIRQIFLDHNDEVVCDPAGEPFGR